MPFFKVVANACLLVLVTTGKADDINGLAALAEDAECEQGADAQDCALNALQIKRSSFRLEDDGNVSVPLTKPGEYGIVAGLYTYGAPSTTGTPLQNTASGSKEFQGLRAYTENIQDGVKYDDAGASWNQLSYHHPYIATLILRDKTDSTYIGGDGAPNLPAQPEIADWGLHGRENYVNRLNNVTVDGKDYTKYGPIRTSREMVHLAFNAYEYTFGDMKRSIKEHIPDWRVVDWESIDTLEAYDNIWLVQNEKNLECTLVFTGTRIDMGLGELGASIKNWPTGYCGMNDVSAGYRDKLWWLMGPLMPLFRPSLAKCSRVLVTGHSLGGSLADLFTACANSGHVDDVDFKRQSWTQGTPELMPEYMFDHKEWDNAHHSKTKPSE